MTNYITKGIGGFYYVKTETGIVECRARGIFRKRGITPVAGDQVVLSADRTTIDEILPRKNVFIRPPVANLDVLFIVASTTQPVPSTLILDELTAAAVYKDVQPVIVITKADLAAADALEKAYADSTIPLIRLDYDTGEGLDQIRAHIAGNLCAFCGNSGVGKSTLLNALAPQLERQTGGISQKLGRGRHTTREVEIFEVCGGLLADTPGFASLDANKICRIPPEELQHAFPEFEPYFGQCRFTGFIPKENLEHAFPEFGPYLGQCQFTGCSHRSEKGCAVRAALEEGKLSDTRYQSYLTMYEEASQLKEWER